MKFELTYYKRKKKGYSKQTAVFYNIEDAMFWEKYIESEGCKDIQINVK